MHVTEKSVFENNKHIKEEKERSQTQLERMLLEKEKKRNKIVTEIRKISCKRIM